MSSFGFDMTELINIGFAQPVEHREVLRPLESSNHGGSAKIKNLASNAYSQADPVARSFKLLVLPYFWPLVTTRLLSMLSLLEPLTSPIQRI
jgi:hypothetical protein